MLINMAPVLASQRPAGFAIAATGQRKTGSAQESEELPERLAFWRVGVWLA
jgi:hypothetical protein